MRFRKIFSVILTAVFLLSVSGLAVKYHYCGDKIASVSVFSPACGCEKSSQQHMPDDCCKNKLKFFKVANDYSPSVGFHYVKVNPVVAAVFNSVNFSFVSVEVTRNLMVQYNPPPSPDGLFLLHSSLLI